MGRGVEAWRESVGYGPNFSNFSRKRTCELLLVRDVEEGDFSLQLSCQTVPVQGRLRRRVACRHPALGADAVRQKLVACPGDDEGGNELVCSIGYVGSEGLVVFRPAAAGPMRSLRLLTLSLGYRWERPGMTAVCLAGFADYRKPVGFAVNLWQDSLPVRCGFYWKLWWLEGAAAALSWTLLPTEFWTTTRYRADGIPNPSGRGRSRGRCAAGTSRSSGTHAHTSRK